MRTVVSLLLPLVLAYAALLLVLVAARPRGIDLRAAVRLLPDLLRLTGRLARDRSGTRRVRAALWLLLGYLAFPLDVVPDVIPVLGYADDLILIGLTLRYVVRVAGPGAVRSAWPGSPDGLRLVGVLARTPL